MSDIEYNFIQNQLEANNKIRSILEYEISSLFSIIHQKRKWIEQVNNNDKELNLRLNSIREKDKKLVKYYNEIK